MLAFKKVSIVIAFAAMALAASSCSTSPVGAPNSDPSGSPVGVTNTQSVTTGPPASPVPVGNVTGSVNVDQLKSLCASPSEVAGYLAGLPGPVQGAGGQPFATNSDNVVDQVLQGIMTDAVSAAAAQVYWGQLDAGRVLGSTAPQGSIDTAQLAQTTGSNPAVWQADCTRLAEQLGAALTTAGNPRVVDLASLANPAKPTQFATLVYSNDYTKSFWLCQQAVPTAGYRVLAFSRYSGDQATGLDPQVYISVDQRTLITLDCPAGAVAANFFATDQPTATASPTPKPSKSPSGGGSGKNNPQPGNGKGADTGGGCGSSCGTGSSGGSGHKKPGPGPGTGNGCGNNCGGGNTPSTPPCGTCGGGPTTPPATPTPTPTRPTNPCLGYPVPDSCKAPDPGSGGAP